MYPEDKILFGLLKKEVAARMMQSYPGIDPEISNWKGQNIIDFQEDLRIKVNGQLSEKWFYTHFKGEGSSLPRIDVLNLLSHYAGYTSWQEFRHEKAGNLTLPEKEVKIKSRKPMFVVILIIALVLVVLLIRNYSTHNYYFTFIDSGTGKPVNNDNLRIEMLIENENPLSINPDEKGIFQSENQQEKCLTCRKGSLLSHRHSLQDAEKFQEKRTNKLKRRLLCPYDKLFFRIGCQFMGKEKGTA